MALQRLLPPVDGTLAWMIKLTRGSPSAAKGNTVVSLWEQIVYAHNNVPANATLTYCGRYYQRAFGKRKFHWSPGLLPNPVQSSVGS